MRNRERLTEPKRLVGARQFVRETKQPMFVSVTDLLREDQLSDYRDCSIREIISM